MSSNDQVSVSTPQTGAPAAATGVYVFDNGELSDEQFVAQVLVLRGEVSARSRGQLRVAPETVAEAEEITRTFAADLIRLAVRRARTHPNDKVVLMDDLTWARKLLVAGTGSGNAWVLLCTTLGGLAMGVGAPMLLAPVLTGTASKVTEGQLAWGAGTAVVGAALLAAGFILAFRRR